MRGIFLAANHQFQGAIMNSFIVTAIGNLAREPETGVKGDTAYTKFCLVGNDYAGKDDHGQPREAVTSMYFVAFDGVGEAIAKHCRTGDQLIVQAHVRSNNYVDKAGEKQYEYSYVVQSFRFGAPGRLKRGEMAARHDEKEMGELETEI
jgi:single-strand DNA-binding protein